MDFWISIAYAVIGFCVGIGIVALWKRNEIVKETKAIRAHSAALWESTRAIQEQTRTIHQGTKEMLEGYLRGEYKVKSTPVDTKIFEVPPRIDGEGYYSSHG